MVTSNADTWESMSLSTPASMLALLPASVSINAQRSPDRDRGRNRDRDRDRDRNRDRGRSRGRDTGWWGIINSVVVGMKRD